MSTSNKRERSALPVALLLILTVVVLCVAFFTPSNLLAKQSHSYTVHAITVDSTSAQLAARLSEQLNAHASDGALISVVPSDSPGRYVVIYKN